MSDELWKEVTSSVVFNRPKILSPSAWTEHVPFAFWLIDSLKPNYLVELGTHYGLSYFSFCQAIQSGHLHTKTYAVDNWYGDEHAGFYDDAVFEFVSKANEPYNSFSTLCRSTFDEALSLFNDNSIDLLHIDGLHTYEAVKHDLENWLPKMSDTGIVLFHDTNVMHRDFGVYRLWEELTKQYPFFEFKHGHGLGVLGVGKKLPKKLDPLFKISSIPDECSAVQEIYERLGGLLKTEKEFHQLITAIAAKEIISADSGMIPIAETYLHPLHTISAQVFWENEGADFNEANSTIQTIDLSETIAHHLFKLDQESSSIKKLRIDPATEQGVFYIHSIAVADTDGKILLDWEEIRERFTFKNLIIIKSALVENCFVAISMSDDPIIEFELTGIQDHDQIQGMHLLISFSGSGNTANKRN